MNCDTGINISHWWFWCENRAVFIADTNAVYGFPLCGAHSISATYIGAEYVSKMKIICCDFIAWLVWLSTKLCCNFHFHTFCFENVPSCGDYYVGFIYCWLFSHCNFMQVYPPHFIALSVLLFGSYEKTSDSVVIVYFCQWFLGMFNICPVEFSGDVYCRVAHTTKLLFHCKSLLKENGPTRSTQRDRHDNVQS